MEWGDIEVNAFSAIKDIDEKGIKVDRTGMRESMPKVMQSSRWSQGVMGLLPQLMIIESIDGLMCGTSVV